MRGLNHHHHGVDIQTYGKPNKVVASKAGKVIIATNGSKGNKLSGYGNVVVIDHGNGKTTLYAHSSSILVTVGQTVQQGQVIKINKTLITIKLKFLNFQLTHLELLCFCFRFY